MNVVECESCGSRRLLKFDGYLICEHCSVRFIPNSGDIPLPDTVISVQSDVQALLEKCRNDPANRRRFANLILDIDPTNTEALKYL